MIVAGGGPAGAALAIRLRLHGLVVMVCETSDRPAATCVGERLTETGARLLRPLGVWDGFLAEGHPRSAGLVSVWGSADPTIADVMNPLTASWHVNRSHFDAMLRHCAALAGADVLLGTRVVGVARTDQGAWNVTLTTGGTTRQQEAEIIVDATGRGGRDLLGRSRFHGASDRLVGLAFVFPSPLERPYSEWTLVEACSSGWWYSAPLPADQSSVIYFTDPDLMPSNHVDPRAFAAACGASFTADRTPRVASERVVRVPAWSGLRERNEVPTWVPVGDAAVSCDPLSGNGLSVALETAVAAADAIAAFVEGDEAPLAHYSDEVDLRFSRHLASQKRLYAVERRWSALPFWQRRHALRGSSVRSSSIE